MTTSSMKEIAKFACGVEAFHAFIHTYFWYSGTTLNVFGVKESPTWHKRAAVGNALVLAALGIYAWRKSSAPPADTPRVSEGSTARDAAIG